jgi:hypothetical protein
MASPAPPLPPGTASGIQPLKKGARAVERKYTVPFTTHQVRSAAVGTVFYDHGTKMRITRIGTPYIGRNDRPAFDTWAVPELGPAQPAA